MPIYIFNHMLEFVLDLFISFNIEQETTSRRAEAWVAVERSLNSRLQVCVKFICRLAMLQTWDLYVPFIITYTGSRGQGCIC